MGVKKRLLTIVGGYFPAVGGGEHCNQRLAALAAASGWEVLVVVPHDGPDVEGEDPENTRVRYVPAQRLLHHRLVRFDLLRDIATDFAPSLVQLNGPNLHDARAIAVARRLGIPCIGVYYADFRSDNIVSRLATGIYGRSVLPKFDHVCVISELYRQRMISRGCSPEHVTNIGVGADLEAFYPASQYNGSQGKRLLFVGRLDANHSYKRLDLLLSAVRALADRGFSPELRVVGDGDRREWAEKIARELRLDDIVHFLGDVNARELADEYRGADVLVLPSPSASEGFGMVVVEAYASGCPAVTSIFAGAREVIDRSGIGALWNGTDVADLSAAIVRCSTAGTERTSVAARARHFSEKYYSWPSVQSRMDDVLNRFA